METKICTRCKEKKYLYEFKIHKKRNKPFEKCIPCKKITDKIARDKYVSKNRDVVNELQRKNRKKRCENNPLETIKNRLRARLSQAFSTKNIKKEYNTKHFLGADFKTVYKHLEQQFKDGISWSNRSKWHIDHIIPLASATTEGELIKLCHYTNLQPLWAEDNLKKGCNIDVNAIGE